MLNLDHIVLGGHSAGGTIALQNADARYFPQIKAAFAYAGHTMVATVMGFPAGTVLALPPRPMLIMGGTEDGVIAASSGRYGQESTHNPILRTFREAAQQGALVIFEGANHFACVHPMDTTTGRGFLESK
jgi:pimeloyl-ACP methyl ester carboxylesterase